MLDRQKDGTSIRNTTMPNIEPIGQTGSMDAGEAPMADRLSVMAVVRSLQAINVSIPQTPAPEQTNATSVSPASLSSVDEPGQWTVRVFLSRRFKLANESEAILMRRAAKNRAGN